MADIRPSAVVITNATVQSVVVVRALVSATAVSVSDKVDGVGRKNVITAASGSFASRVMVRLSLEIALTFEAEADRQACSVISGQTAEAVVVVGRAVVTTAILVCGTATGVSASP